MKSKRADDAVGDLGGAKLSHWSEDALNIGASLQLGCSCSFDVGVLAIGVLPHGCCVGEETEVSVGDMIATDVSATVREASLNLVQEIVDYRDASLSRCLVSVVPHEGKALRLLTGINEGILEPFDLIHALRSGGEVAVLHSKHLQDCHALGEVSSIVKHVDWQLSASTIGSGLLHWAPLCTSDILILKGDTLGSKQVSDGLGASLKWEVNKLWHLKNIFFQL